jgi:hypothetical protein
MLIGAYGAIGVLWLGLVAFHHIASSGERPASLEDERAEQIALARRAIVEAQAFANVEQQLFSSEVLAAEDEDVMPDASAEPCGEMLPEPRALARGRAPFPLLVAARGDRSLLSPSVGELMARVHRAAIHLDHGRVFDATRSLGALTSNPELDREVVVITSARKRPVQSNASSYEPGEISGRAFLYDFREHRIVCAGDVHATSSRAIEYAYTSGTSGASGQRPSLGASLDADLENQLVLATRSSLRRTSSRVFLSQTTAERRRSPSP